MIDDTPQATDLAKEIHARFSAKMKPGGLIDKILNGGEPVRARPALPDAELEVIKHSIDVQLSEYATTIEAAAAWMRERRPKGFRRTKR